MLVIQKCEDRGKIPQVQYIDSIVELPVVMQRHVPYIQTVQRTVEDPQSQYLGRVVDVPVVMQRQKSII